MEKETNSHELLRRCNLLHEKHEKIKEEVYQRSLLNEKSIKELEKIENEYKVIIEKLKSVKEFS